MIERLRSERASRPVGRKAAFDPLDVAVVGLACRYSTSPDAETFWRNALSGVDPADRLNGDRGERLLPSGPDETSLVLEVALAALADAGYAAGACKSTRVDVIISRNGPTSEPRASSILSPDVVRLLRELHPDWSDDDHDEVRCEWAGEGVENEPPVAFAGSPADAVADRLCSRGLSFVVEGAGESAFVALDLAARALSEGRSDLGVVGEIGHGVGILALKRLADAERDGDRIYAVINAVGLSRGHRSRGADKAKSRALAQAGISEDSVDLVAADLDPRPIPNVRLTPTSPPTSLGLLIKTSLALHHRVIPGDRSATRTTGRPWIAGGVDRSRRAAVSASGIRGTAAYVLLEEHSRTADGVSPGMMTEWDTEAILLGAGDREGLVKIAGALLTWLDAGSNADVPLKDLAATLNRGQAAFPTRLGLVAGSTAELRDRLRATVARISDPACEAVRDARGTYFWDEPLGGRGRIAFLYPGEGSQYPGMLADLCPHFPEVRTVLDTADRIAAENGHRRMPSEQLFGEPADDGGGLHALETAVNVVLSAHWGLHQLAVKLGLRPDAVVGHSSGEILALAAAGAARADRSFEAGLGELGSVLERLERGGRVPSAILWAVAADRGTVETLCGEGCAARVAIDNCPHQVVVACPPESAPEFASRLKARGLMFEELPFSRAYHTERFAQALDPLRRFFGSLDLQRPRTRVYSCATASRMPPDAQSVRSLAVDQWVSPVRFRETVEAMYADGVRVFLEIGARGNLTGYVEDVLRGKPHFAISMNVLRRTGVTQLNHVVAALYAHGVNLDPEILYARRRPRVVALDRDLPPAPSPPRSIEPATTPRLSDRLIAKLRGHATRRSESPTDLPAQTASFAGTQGPVTDRAMLSYFETMDAFLETQRAVTDAYLAGPRADSDANRIAPNVPPLEVPGRPSPESLGAEPAGPDVAAPGEGVGRHVDASEVLLEQVARRTGYPKEILDLGQDMEADLGIDSIKRVEIFGEMQERGFVPGGVDLDRLSLCRTLAQVVQLLEAARGVVEAATSAHGPWAGDVVSFTPGREFVGRLRLDAATDPVAAHHTLGGRRVSEIDRTRLGFPVVPFTIMVEWLAQAACALSPGRVVRAFRDVHAHRWVPYFEDAGRPVTLDVRASVKDAPDEVLVSIRTTGGDAREAVSGTVVLGTRRDDAPAASVFEQSGSTPCRLSAEELYGDQWLFHGPALQAVAAVGPASASGIEGTLRVLPRRDLLPERLWPVLHTDPIVLDAFTHLLGAWGLDQRAGVEGDLMFPLRVGEILLSNAEPAEGTRLECRVSVRDVSRHRVRADADLVTPDGRAWVRVRDWEDWRFYWPGRYRDAFRDPAGVFVGERIPLDRPPADVSAVWMEPPGDFARAVWRDVLEWVQLGPDERRSVRASGLSESARTLEIWGRVAAKEAVRRLHLGRVARPIYPNDLTIVSDATGGLVVRNLAEPDVPDANTISYAFDGGVAVAIASLDPTHRPGVAVERRHEGEYRGNDKADSEDLALLGPRKDAPDDWPARLRCARLAAEKSAGPGVRLDSVDLESSKVRAVVGGRRFVVQTATRGESVWAWTLGAAEDEGATS